MLKLLATLCAAGLTWLAATAPAQAQSFTIGEDSVRVTIIIADCTDVWAPSDSQGFSLGDTSQLSYVEFHETMWTALIMAGMPFEMVGRSEGMAAVAQERASLALERCRAGHQDVSAIPLQVWTSYYRVTPESIGTTADEVRGFVRSFFYQVAREELELCRQGKFDLGEGMLLDGSPDDQEGCTGSAETLQRLVTGPLTYADIGTDEAEVERLLRLQRIAQAQALVERCRGGDTLAGSMLELKMDDGNLTAADLGVPEAELYGYVHAYHVSWARGMLERCLADSSEGAARLHWIENYMDNTGVQPWEIGLSEATRDSLRRAAEELERRHRERAEEPKRKL